MAERQDRVFIYEHAERIAICIESGVHPREAVEVANRQCKVGSHSVPDRPY